MLSFSRLPPSRQPLQNYTALQPIGLMIRKLLSVLIICIKKYKPADFICFILTRTPENNKVYTSSYPRFVNTAKIRGMVLCKSHNKKGQQTMPPPGQKSFAFAPGGAALTNCRAVLFLLHYPRWRRISAISAGSTLCRSPTMP